MLLFLFFALILFCSNSLQDCPQNKAYGPNCQNTCTNCFFGCDVVGSCNNSICVLGFYGTGCQTTNIKINQAPNLTPVNCAITVAITPYSGNTTINPTSYYVVNGPTVPTNPTDFRSWNTGTPMTCAQNYCQAVITMTGGTFSFGVYFTFNDINYADAVQSLVSPLASTTCTTALTIPSTPITTTASTSTTASTPITVSTPNTGPTVSTILTTTISSTSAQNPTFCSRTANSINVCWGSPVNNNNFNSYTVTVLLNNNQVFASNTVSQSTNITNLKAGTKYTIKITTNYGTGQSTVGNPIDMCTMPATDVLVDNVQVLSQDRKSITVSFPIDRTNYTCSINIYRLGIVPKMTSSRRKRAASQNSMIPSGATIQLNNTQIPSQIIFDNLNSATNYTIYAEIYTNVDGIVTHYYSITNQQTNGPTDGAIIGIVLGILLILLIILLVLLLLFLYRRKKQKYLSNNIYYNNESPLKEIVDEDKPRSFAYWSNISDRMQPRSLVLNPDDWTEVYNNIHQRVYNPPGVRFIEEYDGLPFETTYSSMEGEANYIKNKRQDILPFDHNRVKLRISSSNESDYINASFIDGYIRKRAYIAAQSPFDGNTTNDFWKMIYDHNIGQIVMLTEAEFDNIATSVQYWPSLRSKHNANEKIYGTISVKIIKESEFAHYHIRTFEIKDSTITTSQIVTQYQFHGWPHNDIPENSIAFLDFYQSIKVQASISNGPLLVHCGSGISQTAVYIAFDILNQKVVHENSVNVYRVVAEIRRARSKMIINVKQYMFIYDLLFESLLSGQFVITNNVRRIMKLIHKVNPRSNVEYIREQFLLLQSYHMVTRCHHHKNKDIFFVDSIDASQSLAIMPSPAMNSESINAFWNTIYNENIEVIVDLRTTDDNPYYILNKLQNFDISISYTSQISKNFQKIDISLLNSRDTNKMKIQIYQLGTNWVTNNDNASEPHHSECVIWVELIDHLINEHSNQLILVHCNNGWSKSGIFLTCLNVAMKMLRSKYVMIYNVVKSMKFYRYEFVTSFTQFKFIYTFLKKWVDVTMPNDTDYVSGLLNDGDMRESLFTHEQTPVFRPDEKELYAPSLYTLGNDERHFNSDDTSEKEYAVHYEIGSINDYGL